MPAQSFAQAPQQDGLLADIESALRERSQPDQSGFLLLNSNEQGLRWCLALIDSARHSIDLQYSVWWGDESGDLMMQRVIEAANRGVRLRLILDDPSTMLEDEAHPKLRDVPTAVIDSHPNIDVRLFNAWRHRAISGRVIETFERLERINHRMHNRLLVVDNRATIIGVRYIGNECFGLSPTFNFRDLDVPGVGPGARQASGVFDRFWNSHWVMEVAVLGIQVPPGALQGHEELLEARLVKAPGLALFLQEPDDREERFMALPARLHLGSSRVHTDNPDADAVTHHMPEAIRALIGSAQNEVLIMNACVIPDRLFLDQLAEQARNGVRLRLLTNSLASHDVPAVNSHYKQWRRALLEAGAELYELRHDAALKSSLADTAPNEGEFVGLHVKAAAIDRERVFIG